MGLGQLKLVQVCLPSWQFAPVLLYRGVVLLCVLLLVCLDFSILGFVLKDIFWPSECRYSILDTVVFCPCIVMRILSSFVPLEFAMNVKCDISDFGRQKKDDLWAFSTLETPVCLSGK